MLFYKIHLTDLPQVIFSCHAELEHYSNSFAKLRRFLEISLVEQGTIQAQYADHMELICPGELMVITEKTVCDTSCIGRQVHTTVGVHAGYTLQEIDSRKLCLSDLDALEADIVKSGLIILPHVLPLGTDYSPILQRLHTIATRYAGAGPGRSQLCLAGWLELTACLTQCCLRRMRQEHSDLSPAVFLYAERAKQYVQVHCHEPICAGNVAAQLGISTNYLHAVFKAATGQTLMQYINRMKMMLAMQYIRKYNAGAVETAHYIGIEDSFYFCRLFKKYCGLTLREYRQGSADGNML